MIKKLLQKLLVLVCSLSTILSIGQSYEFISPKKGDVFVNQDIPVKVIVRQLDFKVSNLFWKTTTIGAQPTNVDVQITAPGTYEFTIPKGKIWESGNDIQLVLADGFWQFPGGGSSEFTYLSQYPLEFNSPVSDAGFLDNNAIEFDFASPDTLSNLFLEYGKNDQWTLINEFTGLQGGLSSKYSWTPNFGKDTTFDVRLRNVDGKAVTSISNISIISKAPEANISFSLAQNTEFNYGNAIKIPYTNKGAGITGDLEISYDNGTTFSLLKKDYIFTDVQGEVTIALTEFSDNIIIRSVEKIKGLPIYGNNSNVFQYVAPQSTIELLVKEGTDFDFTSTVNILYNNTGDEDLYTVSASFDNGNTYKVIGQKTLKVGQNDLALVFAQAGQNVMLNVYKEVLNKKIESFSKTFNLTSPFDVSFTNINNGDVFFTGSTISMDMTNNGKDLGDYLGSGKTKTNGLHIRYEEAGVMKEKYLAAFYSIFWKTDNLFKKGDSYTHAVSSNLPKNAKNAQFVFYANDLELGTSAKFEIRNPIIELLSPLNGQVYSNSQEIPVIVKNNESTKITTSMHLRLVDIASLSEIVTQYSITPNGLNAGTNTVSFSQAGTNVGQYKFILFYGNEPVDTSNTFELVEGKIEVSTNNKIYKKTEDIDLTFNVTGITAVNIHYSQDNGQTWNKLAGPQFASTNTFKWLGANRDIIGDVIIRVQDFQNTSEGNTAYAYVTIAKDNVYEVTLKTSENYYFTKTTEFLVEVKGTGLFNERVAVHVVIDGKRDFLEFWNFNPNNPSKIYDLTNYEAKLKATQNAKVTISNNTVSDYSNILVESTVFKVLNQSLVLWIPANTDWNVALTADHLNAFGDQAGIAKYVSDKQGEIKIGTQLQTGTHQLTVIWTPNDALYDTSSAVVTAEVSIITTSVDQTNQTFEVYPNPVQNELYVNVTGTVQNISIVNAQGQIVKSVNTFDNVINTSDLSEGIYSIKVETTTKVFVSTFIKK